MILYFLLKEGGIFLFKRYLYLLLMLVIVASISGVGEASERDISLENASEILFDFLSGQKNEGGLDPVTINPLIEVVGFSNPTNTTVYYVKAGDMLYKIAQEYNTTVNRIKELNNLTSDYLYIGQKLYLAGNNENELVYYVKAGDALYKLARKYSTTVSRIKQLNNLNSDNLYIGQKLIIPLQDLQTEFTHYVQSGDTLYKLAIRYGITVQNIKTKNNLFSDYLYVGQKLRIPIDGVNENHSGRRLSVTQNEMDLFARTVYSEARGEPYDGQVAIAAVVINRVLHPLFPNSVEGVVFQPWQFTAVHDGQFWLQPNQGSYKASEDALNGWDPTGGAIYYYNPRTASSEWIFYRKVIVQIGQHLFAV